MRLDGAVALAGHLSQAVPVCNIDVTPAVTDNSGPAEAHERRSKSRCVVRRSAAPGIPVSSTTFRCRMDRARNSQRARRASTKCEALHAADCWAGASSACSCRATIARKVTRRRAPFDESETRNECLQLRRGQGLQQTIGRWTDGRQELNGLASLVSWLVGQHRTMAHPIDCPNSQVAREGLYTV